MGKLGARLSKCFGKLGFSPAKEGLEGEKKCLRNYGRVSKTGVEHIDREGCPLATFLETKRFEKRVRLTSLDLEMHPAVVELNEIPKS